MNSTKIFTPRLRRVRRRTDQPRAETDQPLAEPRPQINTDESLSNNLTVDFRRFPQIRIRTFHRRDAEYGKGRFFAQSGDNDWAKAYSSNLSNVFVCRRLPTNKKLILCALCASAVIHSLSAIICVNQRLIAPNALPYAPCA